MSGSFLINPGVCYNRAVDFKSYIWTPTTTFSSSGESSEMLATSNDTDMVFSEDEMAYIESVRMNTIIYLYPTFLLVGTFGNVISFGILLKLARHTLTSCLYLTILAVIDTLVLYTRCGNDWLKEAAAQLNPAAPVDVNNLIQTSDVGCRVFPFLFHCVFDFGRWLIVCALVEGSLGTCRPTELNVWCRMTRAKNVLLLLGPVIFSVNVHYFWSFDLFPFEEITLENYTLLECNFDKHGRFNEQIEILFPIVDQVVSEVLPLLTLLVCGSLMAVQLRRGEYRKDPEQAAWRRAHLLDPEGVDELHKAFAALAFAVPLLVIPKFLYNVHFLATSTDSDNESTSEESWVELANIFVSSLDYVNMSCKFVVYLVFSRKFRRLFTSIFIYRKEDGTRDFGQKMAESQRVQRQPLMAPVSSEKKKKSKSNRKSENIEGSTTTVQTSPDCQQTDENTERGQRSPNSDSVLVSELVV